MILLQILVFLFAANVEPGVHINGFLTALVGSFVYAIINTILTAVLGIDSGDSFYGLLIQNLLLKRAAPKSDQPGLVIVQIDGLAHPILAGRMRAGSVNTMAELGPQRHPPARALGGDPAVDDVGEPGRASSTATTTASPPSAGTSATAST